MAEALSASGEAIGVEFIFTPLVSGCLGGEMKPAAIKYTLMPSNTQGENYQLFFLKEKFGCNNPMTHRRRKITDHNDDDVLAAT